MRIQLDTADGKKPESFTAGSFNLKNVTSDYQVELSHMPQPYVLKSRIIRKHQKKPTDFNAEHRRFFSQREKKKDLPSLQTYTDEINKILWNLR